MHQSRLKNHIRECKWANYQYNCIIEALFNRFNLLLSQKAGPFDTSLNKLCSSKSCLNKMPLNSDLMKVDKKNKKNFAFSNQLNVFCDYCSVYIYFLALLKALGTSRCLCCQFLTQKCQFWFPMEIAPSFLLQSSGSSYLRHLSRW